VTGKPRQKSKTFIGGKRDAGKALNEFAASVAKAKPGTASTLNDLIAKHIEGLEAKGRAPDTIRNYRRTQKAVSGGIGRVQLRKVGPRDLEDFYRAELATLKPSSVALDHRHLSAALEQGVRWGWIEKNPARLAQPPPAKGRAMEPPTVQQVKALLLEAAVRDLDRAMLVFLAVMTGTRRGELCRLQWRDVDRMGSSLLIRTSKTGKPRRITLDRATVHALEVYHLSIADRRGRDPGAEAFVFSPDLGATPWDPRTVTTWWDWLRKKAGVGPVRLHDLRHFSVTHLLDVGVPLNVVSARHGHDRASMTLDVYGHAIRSRDQEAADEMGRLGIDAPNALHPHPS
jgi:integrase